MLKKKDVKDYFEHNEHMLKMYLEADNDKLDEQYCRALLGKMEAFAIVLDDEEYRQRHNEIYNLYHNLKILYDMR